MMRKRNHYIDLFRVISATCVMLYHFTTRYDQMIGHAVPYEINFGGGYMGWAIFFIMTGYLVNPFSWQKHKSALVFFIKKYLRLYPGFLIASVVLSCYTALIIPQYAVTMKEWFVNLTMIGPMLGNKSVVGVDWTIIKDLLYYAFVAAVIFSLNHFKKYKPTGNQITAGVIVYSIAVASGYMLYQKTGNGLLKYISVLTAGQHFHLFAIGLIIRNAINKGNRLLTALGLAIEFALQGILFKNHGFLVVVVVFSGLLILTMCISQKKTKPIVKRPVLEAAADCTYLCYLLHEYMGFGILLKLDQAGYTSQWFLLIPITITIAITWVLHCCVEMPLIGMISKQMHRKHCLQK